MDINLDKLHNAMLNREPINVDGKKAYVTGFGEEPIPADEPTYHITIRVLKDKNYE